MWEYKKSQDFYRIRIQKFFYRWVWLNWLTTLNPFVGKLGTLNRSANPKINLQDTQIKNKSKWRKQVHHFFWSSTNVSHSTLKFWCHILLETFSFDDFYFHQTIFRKKLMQTFFCGNKIWGWQNQCSQKVVDLEIGR